MLIRARWCYAYGVEISRSWQISWEENSAPVESKRSGRVSHQLIMLWPKTIQCREDMCDCEGKREQLSHELLRKRPTQLDGRDLGDWRKDRHDTRERAPSCRALPPTAFQVDFLSLKLCSTEHRMSETTWEITTTTPSSFNDMALLEENELRHYGINGTWRHYC